MKETVQSKRKLKKNPKRVKIQIKEATGKTGHNHNVQRKTNSHVVLSPVFSTKEQEKLFAQCAKKTMSTEAMLRW